MNRGSSPSLQHHREVVQRRVGVRPARGLDPGGDVVVVAVAAFVVQHRPVLQRVLGPRDRDAALAELGRRGERQLERVQRGARVAFAARGEELDRLAVDHRVIRHGPPQHRRHLLVAQGLQCIHARAREQRAVDLERGVLGGRADQRDQTVLDRRQQRVLLGLVEAVDLVEEEHGLGPAHPTACGAAMSRPLQHRAHLGAARLHGAQLLEHRIRMLRHDPRERRLAGARRSVQDHRVGVPLLDRRAQRRAVAQEVRLPDEVGERRRPHARRQRAIVLGGVSPGLGIRLHRRRTRTACPSASVSRASRICPQSALDRARSGQVQI